MKMNPVLRKIFFITVPAIFIFLIALELCLRMCGYLYIQCHNPETQAKIAEFNKDRFRILCLGDSFTEGVGATPEGSYPRQLEKILQKNLSKEISVVNGGRLANTSSLLLKNLQEDINRYSPSVIIVMIGMNNNWNLEDSSYFLLNSSSMSFPKRLERLLSSFRIYKLLKIGWMNFKHKMELNKKIASANKPIQKIKPESLRLSTIGNALYMKGEYALAIEKLQEALKIDKNNYDAHLALGHIWNIYKNYQLAKKELWKGIYLVDEWDTNILSNIICQIRQLDDAVINKESELMKLKKYLQDKYMGEKRDKLGNIVDVSLKGLKNQGIYDEILEYDLKEIIRIAEKDKIKVILATYPQEISLNAVIREISKKYNLPLVDNSKIFEEKLVRYDRKDFFVSDGHCNENGYKLIAEAAYDTLVKKGMLPKKETGD